MLVVGVLGLSLFLLVKSYNCIIGVNEWVNFVVVGINGCGNVYICVINVCKDVEVIYLCDVDIWIYVKFKKLMNKLGMDMKIGEENDFCKIFEDKDVDVVSIVMFDYFYVV